ncbi:MAG: hypothetical protein K1X42_08185 [Opitutaceae bacterium]|nr:hypothetical protein [Opitutaceae bacterium]
MSKFSENLPLFSLAICIAGTPLVGAPAKALKADINPSAARTAMVEKAQKLSRQVEVANLAATTVDPFSPASFNAPDPEEMRLAAEAARRARGVPGPRVASDRDLLIAIAHQIKPTGTMNLGGESILLVGSQKIRVGESLSASYEGKPIAVTVTAIDRTSFSLRLNGEEFTRPIKSGSNP